MTTIYKAKSKLAVAHRRQSGLCGICRGPLKLAEANLDHIVPRALGGIGTLSNLQATHVRCNSKKGAAFDGDPLAATIILSRLPKLAFEQQAKPAKHSRRGRRGGGCS